MYFFLRVFLGGFIINVQFIQVCLLQNRLLITHILIHMIIIQNVEVNNLLTIMIALIRFLYLFASSTCTTIKICHEFIEDNWCRHEIVISTHQTNTSMTHTLISK